MFLILVPIYANYNVDSANLYVVLVESVWLVNLRHKLFQVPSWLWFRLSLRLMGTSKMVRF
jgi:hypothetical protein